MWERSFVVYYNVGKIFAVLLLKKLNFVYLLACHYLFCENMSFWHSLLTMAICSWFQVHLWLLSGTRGCGTNIAITLESAALLASSIILSLPSWPIGG